ncbi:TOBE domain-containing protein [Castellaniella sp.]|uniref:TOBE domain-containing protein n=1 Tax=Castellaniella sp. TaxID=1955812 RepID=UPI002AFF5550|nr:TOBE domain-containing protein [Castellaniella sp.]
MTRIPSTSPLASGPDSSLELSTTLSLRSGSQSWGTERRMALLAAIGTEGSISAAARKVGLSYKAAWDAVDMMNGVAGGLLVERVTGGKRGGGAHLTDRARELIAWYQAAQAEHQRFMEALARFGPDGTRHLDLLHSMALQTSARNRYEGTIGAIESGSINDRIRLDLDEGISLTATLTHASTERLGLAEGRRALAFLKAQAVRVLPQDAVDRDTAPEGLNRWTGRISHRADDGILAEISLDVSARVRITGLAAPDAPAGGLASGELAAACFQAADVLIGTMD